MRSCRCVWCCKSGGAQSEREILWKISQLSVHNLHFWWAIPVICLDPLWIIYHSFHGVAKVFPQQFYFASFASSIFFVSFFIFFLFFAHFLHWLFQKLTKIEKFLRHQFKIAQTIFFYSWKSFLNFFPSAFSLTPCSLIAF